MLLIISEHSRTHNPLFAIMSITKQFGVILGFFLPWVVALISYSIYMMSNPAAAFKDEIARLHKK